jgi:HK97 gp10 family phage protein
MATTKQTFEVEGLKELDNALGELPKATARNVLLRVLKGEGAPITETAKQLAPDDPRTGGKDLHTSIVMKTTKARKRVQAVEVEIGPTTAKFYGIFHEFGTAKMAAHPFMRPAFDGQVSRVLAGIKDRLREEIEKARARLARKAAREAAKMLVGK